MTWIDLAGRTALVLGAADELGRSAADALAGFGAHVVVADTDRTLLEQAYGADDRFDIRPMGECARLALDGLASEFPDTDVLVHCPPDDETAARDDIPCGSAIRSFSPAMITRGRGSIIALSARSPRTRPRTDKTRIDSGGPIPRLVKDFASELKPYGVRVNQIAPEGTGMPHALAFFASDRSSHVTGSVLVVDGEWTVIGSLSAPS